jgi:hypothetical protein
MVIVKVVYMNGKETEYNVDYPKAYIAKIMESENDLTSERKTVAEIYAGPKLIAEFIGSELRLVEPKPKKTAGMGRYKGHTVPTHDDRTYSVKDKIKAEEDWNEYQAEILHAQKMLKENVWVINKYTMDHTGGNVKITYS